MERSPCQLRSSTAWQLYVLTIMWAATRHVCVCACAALPLTCPCGSTTVSRGLMGRLPTWVQ